MRILCLDTTTEKIYICIQYDSNRVLEYLDVVNKKHNVMLLPYIEEILNKNNYKINDFDFFGVVIGPGSFTGIRLGVATINALAFSLNKKIVTITTLEELDDGSDKVVLLDCKHDNYYAASFGSNISYFETTKQELEKIQLPIEYLDTIEPSKILDKCIEKVENNIFVKQAEPFYIKKSSAERLK